MEILAERSPFKKSDQPPRDAGPNAKPDTE